jgi:DNA-binding LacI/PurR family transcriptional regulator
MAAMSDVAKLANVSVSTVSYVLTGARPISQATRDKVLEAMVTLDYQPNALARGLASRRSGILGLLLPMTERGLGATETAFVTGAAEAASQAGYHLMLHPLGSQDLTALGRLASQRLLEGALVMEVRLADARIGVLRRLGVPLVLIGRTTDPGDLPYVDIDFDQTVDGAVEHLVGLGHRRIVYVNQSAAVIEGGYSPACRTRDAYLAAMARLGLPSLMLCAENCAVDGRRVLGQALDQAPDLTAVLGMNEHAMFGVLNELAARGRRVPDDVSVLSILTSSQVAQLASPELTAMTAPGSKVGRTAVEVLLRTLAKNPGLPTDPDQHHQQLLPCTLDVRGSTGPARPPTTAMSGANR